MRGLISLIVSSLLLNFSVHAGSATKSSTGSDQVKDVEENREVEGNPHSWTKQEMEDSADKSTEGKKYRGFEYNPYPYSPSNTPEERVQTKDQSP